MYTSVPMTMTNATSMQQVNSRKAYSPSETQEQDEEDTNPLLEVEVRDIVNNYLDDSLQEGDDIRNGSE